MALESRIALNPALEIEKLSNFDMNAQESQQVWHIPSVELWWWGKAGRSDYLNPLVKSNPRSRSS